MFINDAARPFLSNCVFLPRLLGIDRLSNSRTHSLFFLVLRRAYGTIENGGLYRDHIPYSLLRTHFLLFPCTVESLGGLGRLL